MKIFYDSLTGMGRSFAEKLGYESHSVHELNPYDLDEKIFLITRSINFGQVPDNTLDFLDDLKDFGKLNLLVGTAVTGNKNWGENYGKAGETIEKDYGIPLILKFEARGFKRDIEVIKEFLDKEKD